MDETLESAGPRLLANCPQQRALLQSCFVLFTAIKSLSIDWLNSLHISLAVKKVCQPWCICDIKWHKYFTFLSSLLSKTSSDRSLKQAAVFGSCSRIFIPPNAHTPHDITVQYTALVFTLSLAHSTAILVLDPWKCYHHLLKSAILYSGHCLFVEW